MQTAQGWRPEATRAETDSAWVHPTAVVHPSAVLGRGVRIGPYAIIGEGVVLGDGTVVEMRAMVVRWTTVGRHNHIGIGAVVGNDPQDLKFHGERTELVLGDDNEIGAYVTISRGTAAGHGETRVGNGCRLHNYSHIGHDCQVGNGVVLEERSGISGHVTLEDEVIIGSMAGIHQFSKIGRGALIQPLSMVNKDVPPFVVVGGNVARVVGLHEEGFGRAGLPEQDRQDVIRAFELLYHAGLNVAQAVEQMEQELGGSVEVDRFIRFLRNASRGICR
ncbi:MAG: acyl-ACP--UDP-N-acetylglucosamine O-acyltransferase [Limnochordaceae bacterium]|nr:acyl-ACP--UDP-N-acetylglucosamine O-acyltransferase [Limnochordaceae bacterium]